MKKFENAELEVLEIEATANGWCFFHHEGEQLKGPFTGYVYYKTQIGPVQETPATPATPANPEPDNGNDFTNQNS